VTAPGLQPAPAGRAEGEGPTQALLVLVTAPDAEAAAALARALVEARLAACGSLVAGLRSIYRWEGRLHDEPEVLLLLKTTRASFAALRDEVLRRHPYQVPEVLALPVEAGSAPYLAWLAGEVGSPTGAAG
jgi:periplasmic divalent cation tolerance protein